MPDSISDLDSSAVVLGSQTAFATEDEPNNSIATAQAVTTPLRLRGNLFIAPFAAGVDVDIYKVTAQAGDKLFVATLTGMSAASTDTLLDVLASDGTTILEADDEDGTISGSASNIAGLTLPTAGDYYVRVQQFGVADLGGTIRHYDLYLQLVSGAPSPEVEPNNNGGTPNPLPVNGYVSGAIGAAADNDTYSFTANAGDTIVVIADIDPERDAPEWNARVAIGAFNNFFLIANGSAVGGAFDDANPSEALAMTTRTTGPHVIYVDEATGGGGAAFTYQFVVFIVPRDNVRTCTTYPGTGGAIADLATTNFNLNVPDSKIIDNLRLVVNATHAATADLDVSLISPDGNEVVLYDDPATTGTATAPQINHTIDDEAAVPAAAFGIHSGTENPPELYARMAYFKGMQAQGNWTLRMRDDLTANAGTLNSWGLEVCEKAPVPACTSTTIVSTDFESGDAGFTHSGTADEWERGLPAFGTITTAHSGANAWKTDLDNTYDASSNQDLLSPNINLVGANGTVTLSWWQKYQMESASFDPFWVAVREVGNPMNTRKVFEWRGATQTRAVGNPSTTVQMSAGWGLVEADISDFIGLNVEVVYHLQSDGTGQFPGLAIDDFSVAQCVQTADVSITKTDGATTEEVGTSVTYTIVVTNNGPGAAPSVAVADTFASALTGCSTTCSASAGSTCTAGPTAGNINDTASLAVGGTATYTATCNISATTYGTLSNTATATVGGGVVDPTLGNNTATDVDILNAIFIDGFEGGNTSQWSLVQP